MIESAKIMIFTSYCGFLLTQKLTLKSVVNCIFAHHHFRILYVVTIWQETNVCFSNTCMLLFETVKTT